MFEIPPKYFVNIYLLWLIVFANFAFFNTGHVFNSPADCYSITHFGDNVKPFFQKNNTIFSLFQKKLDFAKFFYEKKKQNNYKRETKEENGNFTF